MYSLTDITLFLYKHKQNCCSVWWDRWRLSCQQDTLTRDWNNFCTRATLLLKREGILLQAQQQQFIHTVWSGPKSFTQTLLAVQAPHKPDIWALFPSNNTQLESNPGRWRNSESVWLACSGWSSSLFTADRRSGAIVSILLSEQLKRWWRYEESIMASMNYTVRTYCWMTWTPNWAARKRSLSLEMFPKRLSNITCRSVG